MNRSHPLIYGIISYFSFQIDWLIALHCDLYKSRIDFRIRIALTLVRWSFCFKINQQNSGPPIKYRFHNLLGSESSRCNHSNPIPVTHLGALLLLPASKSIVAPIAKNVLILGNWSLYLCIHFSCFGAPTPTAKTVAPELLIISMIFRHSSSFFSNPNEGECAATTISLPSLVLRLS